MDTAVQDKIHVADYRLFDTHEPVYYNFGHKISIFYPTVREHLKHIKHNRRLDVNKIHSDAYSFTMDDIVKIKDIFGVSADQRYYRYLINNVVMFVIINNALLII